MPSVTLTVGGKGSAKGPFRGFRESVRAVGKRLERRRGVLSKDAADGMSTNTASRSSETFDPGLHCAEGIDTPSRPACGSFEKDRPRGNNETSRFNGTTSRRRTEQAEGIISNKGG